MQTQQCTEERFLKDVAKHVMTIEADMGSWVFSYSRARSSASSLVFFTATSQSRKLLSGGCWQSS
jgi:hypothetical protein